MKRLFGRRARSPHFDSSPDRRIFWVLFETLTVLTAMFEIFEMLDASWGGSCRVLSSFHVFATSGVMQLIGSCSMNERKFLDEASTSSMNDPQFQKALDQLASELAPLPCGLTVLLAARGEALAASDKRKLEGAIRILEDLCSQHPDPVPTCILQFMRQFQLRSHNSS